MVAAKLFIDNAEFVGIAWSPDRELEFSNVGCPLALHLSWHYTIQTEPTLHQSGEARFKRSIYCISGNFHQDEFHQSEQQCIAQKIHQI